jgi:hypothetical protein
LSLKNDLGESVKFKNKISNRSRKSKGIILNEIENQNKNNLEFLIEKEKKSQDSLNFLEEDENLRS